ncbi:DUF3040 domain-containing protein [Nonomuraea aridisoli]|uniref:DUF3040 domain-containing protein n=1 Tax=Nonomuraea aridisoli TaxID=2070368 RepID=A0A2W2FB25_9ACTN|nr:DUF3040 domain-containing protein [Nonomuraea aridisoli]PZG12774.1 hypothetical protein C1J01_31765 [Nonomuraea aridisoli]
MGLSGRERRILAEIERALEQEDPDFARRLAEIERVEAERARAGRWRGRLPRGRAFHAWVILVLGLLVIVLLLAAVLAT